MSGSLDFNVAFPFKQLKIFLFDPQIFFIYQVLGPLGEEEEFLPEDIDLLEVYVKQQSAKQIKSELKSMGYKGDKYVEQGSHRLEKSLNIDGILELI